MGLRLRARRRASRPVRLRRGKRQREDASGNNTDTTVPATNGNNGDNGDNITTDASSNKHDEQL